MERKTFKATLHSPLFYSSSEGTEIRTNPILSSTALTHAIGYTYRDLEKRYALLGEPATTPDYSHLNDLSLFITDMKPVNAKTAEKTFRTTDYRSERNITLMDGSNYKIPEYLSNARAAWHTIRQYVGIEPASVYEFTVWSTESLPDTLRFKMGIRQSGEFTAVETETADSVILNLFMLKNVYGLTAEELVTVTSDRIEFERGNDPRLQHLKNVSIETAEELAARIL